MDREQMFVVYFSAIVGWQFHPGTDERKSLHECREIALEMLRMTEELWPGLPEV